MMRTSIFYIMYFCISFVKTVILFSTKNYESINDMLGYILLVKYHFLKFRTSFLKRKITRTLESLLHARTKESKRGVLASMLVTIAASTQHSSWCTQVTLHMAFALFRLFGPQFAFIDQWVDSDSNPPTAMNVECSHQCFQLVELPWSSLLFVLLCHTLRPMSGISF